ncbi:hypothetical protein [Synechococcus sp. ROS8604]|uniref:hypothetical protein n=1 Tax=Synechococcus sp. ROS8604 TaxID=1442557 RepID=UPI002103F813|nr:hypothetical protein [Synechococcus sp. ROS8604]
MVQPTPLTRGRWRYTIASHHPLDTYSAEASGSVIGIFTLWGLSQLVIGIIYLATCLRYKALIPLLYALGSIEYGVRAFYIGHYKPIKTMGEAPGAIINIPLMIILIAMLLLSLWRKDHPERRQSY